MKHIVLIEDDANFVFLIRKFLEPRGYRLTHISKPLSNLPAIEQAVPDLILIDVHLATVDGCEVARVLTDHPQLQHIPLVVVTADASIRTQQRAYASGCEDVVLKPVDFHQFLDQITKYFDTPTKAGCS